MKKVKFEQAGFAHYMFLILGGVGLVIIGSFIIVLRDSHKTKLPSTTVPAITKSSTAKTSTPTKTTQPTGSSSSNKSTSSSAPSTSTSTPTSSPQTPLSALTDTLSGLYDGNQVNVTQEYVDVQGPKSTAQARPIVFSVNGTTYFAYTFDSPIPFTTNAADSAGKMTIATATVSSPTLDQAHLDKSGNLVNPELQPVGYSSGGD